MATVLSMRRDDRKLAAHASLEAGAQAFAKTNSSINPLYQQQRFTHHGLSFYTEAEGWQNGHVAREAMATLRKWVTQCNANETTRLFVALLHEREAIIQERDFDYQQEPLPAVRAAQRNAVREAMPEKDAKDMDWPLLVLEAGVL